MNGPPAPAQPAGAPSQGTDLQNAFADHVNRNNMVPVWLHPDVASGVLRHFGPAGHALIHPHPNSGHPMYAGGGVVTNLRAQMQNDPRIGNEFGRPRPEVQTESAGGQWSSPRAEQSTPMQGIPRSIFDGGNVGNQGPMKRTPIFAQDGAVMDGTGGTGQVPGVDLGGDTVPAMLQPGEAVFNKQQLAGIQPRKGKEHLVRPDQKQAMRKASGRAKRK